MSTGTTAPQPSFLPDPSAAQLGFGALLGLSIRRRGGRRSLTAVSSLLTVAALSMLAFPSVTDVLARQRQVHVIQEFSKPAFKTTYRDHRVAIGQGLTRLVIDNARVKVNVLVVEGTTVAALRAGAGHYTNTPYPCGPAGNVGIAGHRTTYGRPFNRINYMKPGDTVTLITPVSRCVYQVVAPSAITAAPGAETSNPFIVLPTNQGVVDQEPAASLRDHWLTLTSCNPPGSAAQRIILRLTMVSCKGATCQSGDKT
jgi:sortase A